MNTTYSVSGSCCGLLVIMLDSRSGCLVLRPGQVIVFCYKKNCFTVTVSLSTQEYKWVLVLSGKEDKMLVGNLMMDWHPILGGFVLLLVASCYGNLDKL